MNVEIVKDGDRVTVQLGGAIRLAEASKLRQVLGQLGKKGPVDLDLTAVDYVDSAGLATLLEFHQRLSSSGRAFRLLGVSPRLREFFELMNLDRVFHIEWA